MPWSLLCTFFPSPYSLSIVPFDAIFFEIPITPSDTLKMYQITGQCTCTSHALNLSRAEDNARASCRLMAACVRMAMDILCSPLSLTTHICIFVAKVYGIRRKNFCGINHPVYLYSNTEKSKREIPVGKKQQHLSEIWRFLICRTSAVTCGTMAYYINIMQIYTASDVLIN
jgi:hypothetical protein